MTDRSQTRQQLVAMRCRLLDDLSERIEGGYLSLLAAITGAITAIDAEPTGDTTTGPLCRPVVTEDGEAIWLTMYAGAERLAVAELNPHRALTLARDLIGAVTAKVR